MKKIACIALIALLTAGCASDKIGKNEAEIDYHIAKDKIDHGQYNDAAKFLEHYSTNHPYSKYTTAAELLRIFASYKGGEYVLSEVLSKEFIDRHPRHPNVDYAQYMLAMSHYKESSVAERDQAQTKDTVKAFEQLLKEHPKSEYAKDARNRLAYLYARLAKHELIIGKFYFDNAKYVAAANRFQTILEKYQTTPAIEEALYYLAASYAKMGMTDNARQTAVLLKHNYPKGDWSRKAEAFL